MYRIFTLLGGLILVSTAAHVSADNQSDFEQAYAEAEAARNQASAVGGEWRDIGEILSEAKKDAASGDYKKAHALVVQALEQSQLGYQQALEQRDPDTLSVFRQ